MSRSLFEEAIADAKQLREVAEQNAKKAIVEAVTPRIKEFIEIQLINGADGSSSNNDFILGALNESDHGDKDEEDVIIPPKKAKKMDETDEIELSESALTALVDLVASKKKSSDPLEEAFSMLSEREKETLLKIVKGEAAPAYDKAAAPAKNETKAKTPEGSGDKKMSMKDLYELDLDDNLDEDKIVIDFGKDITFDRENPYSVEILDSDEEEEDITLEEPPEGEMPSEEEPVEGEEAPEGEGAGEEEESMEEMVYELDENVLRHELSRLQEAKQSKKSAKPEGKKSYAAKAFGGGEVMDEVTMNKFTQLKEAFDNEVRKNRGLQQQLNEYRNGIETLREQLSELNLFNAKLLYVNKISQSRDISAAQRKAVVEALDGAKNLREAKLIYTSLSESLNKGNSATLSESAKRLSPGHASRPTSSGGSKRLTESTQLDRWATLAGLK